MRIDSNNLDELVKFAKIDKLVITLLTESPNDVIAALKNKVKWPECKALHAKLADNLNLTGDFKRESKLLLKNKCKGEFTSNF